MADEVHEGRQYNIVARYWCDYCSLAAVYQVFENADSDADEMHVCEKHKFLAFS